MLEKKVLKTSLRNILELIEELPRKNPRRNPEGILREICSQNLIKILKNNFVENPEKSLEASGEVSS